MIAHALQITVLILVAVWALRRAAGTIGELYRRELGDASRGAHEEQPRALPFRQRTGQVIDINVWRSSHGTGRKVIKGGA